jgi:hypothetical protein
MFVPSSESSSEDRKLAWIDKTLEAAEPFLPGVSKESPTEPVHVIQLRDLEDADSLRRSIAERHPWFDASRGSELVGFVIEEPFLGVWVEKVPGQEEWNPDNELVNRLAQVLVLRRVGRLPHWLEMGIAWNVEMNVRGNVYCFPYRAEFVWASEHTGWHSRVRKWLSKQRTKEIDFGVLAGWPRATFDADAALLAWDTVRYLIEKHGQAVPALLRTMGELHEKKRWHERPDGSAYTIVGFELSPEDQLSVIRAAAGETFLSDLTSWIRKRK